MVVSLRLAAVTTAVRGSPLPSQTRWSLLPGLPRSTGFAPTWSPHAWPARSWCPHSPATSPAGPARPGDPRPGGGADQTPRRWPTRSGDASRSPASRSPALGRAAAARGGGPGHVHDRGQAGPIRDGAVPTAVGRPRWGREQRRHQRPQLIRYEVVSKSRHGARSCQANPKERNDVLLATRQCACSGASGQRRTVTSSGPVWIWASGACFERLRSGALGRWLPRAVIQGGCPGRSGRRGGGARGRRGCRSR
jgi:hypothetical protein